MDKETELYEKLLKIKGLSLDLKSNVYGKKILITADRHSIVKYQLEEIIYAANAAKANLTLMPHGVIEITF